MAFDFSDLQGARFQEDLHRAASYKPIVREDLTKAYKRYKDVGVKLGRVKGKTDAQLYRMATNDVIAWWKKSKEKKATASGTAPNSTLPRGSATPPSGGSSGGSYGSSGGSGGSGGYSGPMLPDTATGLRSTAPKNLPDIPRPLSRQYMLQQYARYGIVGANPPSYVLKNQDTFDAWILRVLRERQAQEAVYASRTGIAAPTATRSSTPRIE